MKAWDITPPIRCWILDDFCHSCNSGWFPQEILDSATQRSFVLYALLNLHVYQQSKASLCVKFASAEIFWETNIVWRFHVVETQGGGINVKNPFVQTAFPLVRWGAAWGLQSLKYFRGIALAWQLHDHSNKSLHHRDEEMRRLSLIMLLWHFGNCKIMFLLEKKKSAQEKAGDRMSW